MSDADAEWELSTEVLPPVEPAPRRRGRYGSQNLVVLGVQAAAWAFLLTVLSTDLVWWGKLALIPLFCALMQGIFSLMHEAFHLNAHRDKRVNQWIGVVGSVLFGTSFTLHRVNHWGHHVRNRAPAEQGEFIHSDENPVGKTVLYYFATCGGLWLSGVVLPIAAFFVPYRAVTWLSGKKRFNTYSAAFEQFTKRDWNAMRAEGLLLLVFWGVIGVFGPWDLLWIAVAYASFAFTWSSLQWVYHLRTPIHVVEGAYNLRLPTPVRWLFLNFNYNLTHHRKPHLPWQELYAASNQQETQPLWYRWLLMAKRPIPMPDDLGMLNKQYF